MVTHRAATIDGGLLGRQRGLDRERQLSSAWWSSVANQGRLGWLGPAGRLWKGAGRRWQEKSLKDPGLWSPAPRSPPEPANPPSRMRKQFLEPVSWSKPLVRVLFQSCDEGAPSMKFSWRFLPRWGHPVTERCLSHTVRAGTGKNGLGES